MPVIAEASELEAAFTIVFVFVFTALVIPDVCVFVFAFTLAVPAAIALARELDALSMCAFTVEAMPAVCE